MESSEKREQISINVPGLSPPKPLSFEDELDKLVENLPEEDEGRDA